MRRESDGERKRKKSNMQRERERTPVKSQGGGSE